MLSNLAMSDISALEAQGIRLTPAEIVRLNCLALRLERSTTAADVTACPRIGWADCVAVYEPTQQVEEWIDTFAARFAADEDSFWSMFLFACCHARVVGFFARPCMATPSGIKREIKRWRATCPATKAQLQVAFEYAYLGDDPGADVVPVPSEKELQRANAGTPQPPTPSAIDEALAAGINLSLAEMRTLTESQLYAVLTRWHANKGYTAKWSSVRAHAEYIRTLSAIKSAHVVVKEAANG